MPNWCNNELYVEGDAEALNAFIEDNQSDTCQLSFEKSVPMPAAVLEAEKLADKYTSPVINWRYQHWGTKWDVDCDPQIQAFEENAVYSFDTANSPPIPWLLAVAKKYPTLSFELSWEELGNDETGRISVQGDEVQDEVKRRGWKDPDDADGRLGYVSCPEGPPQRARRKA